MENNISSGPSSKLFSNRVFQAIIVSGLFLQIGIWIRNFAVLLFVMEQTNGDPFAVSMISVAEFAPIFIFSFIGGTFADRWNPKKTMVWCDILSALSVFAVLITLVFGTWQVVFFVTLISAILSQFSQPSGMKLFKLHLPAEQVQAGMSVYQTIFAIFMVLGPVIGTFTLSIVWYRDFDYDHRFSLFTFSWHTHFFAKGLQNGRGRKSNNIMARNEEWR